LGASRTWSLLGAIIEVLERMQEGSEGKEEGGGR
jgi:hypothetical protein